ncbi:MAG: glycosyltransferase family 2 protein [Candidatus Altiarchaeota archaeon]|nr:glycosyltransferase family 2 protein [Candidatus Altiarchaeota archaeon]
MRLSLVIPAYNEEKRISEVVRTYSKFLKPKLGYELIVVCDGNDRTADMARKEGAKVLEFDHRLGKGGGVIAGFKEAKGDIIAFVDSDMSVGPGDFWRVYSAVGEYDVAIASRRKKGSKTPIRQPFMRRFMSNTFNLTIRIIFGLRISDTQCGAKAFKADSIRKVIPGMRSTGFEFDVELLWRLKRAGYSITEVPVSWSHQEGSTFSLSRGPGMLMRLIARRLGA